MTRIELMTRIGSKKGKKLFQVVFPITLVLLLPRKSSQPSGNNLTITFSFPFLSRLKHLFLTGIDGIKMKRE